MSIVGRFAVVGAVFAAGLFELAEEVNEAVDFLCVGVQAALLVHQDVVEFCDAVFHIGYFGFKGFQSFFHVFILGDFFNCIQVFRLIYLRYSHVRAYEEY